jgi:hypothetical protein
LGTIVEHDKQKLIGFMPNGHIFKIIVLSQFFFYSLDPFKAFLPKLQNFGENGIDYLPKKSSACLS